MDLYQGKYFKSVQDVHMSNCMSYTEHVFSDAILEKIIKYNNIPYTITRRILHETKTAFNPTIGFCVLCTMEKFLIIFRPKDATLNLRSEFFSHCRHKERHLLRKS